MKCINCGAENASDAKFCGNCGHQLLHTQNNIMDRYPKYKFVPTNLIDWQKPFASRVIWMFFGGIGLIFICLCFCAFYALSHYSLDVQLYSGDEAEYWVDCTNTERLEFLDTYGYSRGTDKESQIEEAVQDYKGDIWIRIGIFSAFGGGALLIAFVFYRPYPSPKTKSLRTYADYIQKYHYTGLFTRKDGPKYVFFVKNNKFGLMDVSHYRVQLDAVYDFLEWRNKNKFLNATINGNETIIDINGEGLK